MNRTVMVCALVTAFAGAAGAQQTGGTNPYEGVSTPPPNSTIVNEQPAPPPKPPAAKYAAPTQTPAQPQQGSAGTSSPAEPGQDTPHVQSAPGEQWTAAPAVEPQPLANAQPAASANSWAPHGDGTADGVVIVAPPSGAGGQANGPWNGQSQTSGQAASYPQLWARRYAEDPDGDIVHPQPMPPGEVADGTVIRVRLLDYLSTATSQSGDRFRGQVATDVLQDGSVLIPAGSEIEGRVVEASSGHFAGRGSMDLRPETVTLPDGKRYQMFAMLSGTPGSRAQVGAEGTVTPGSRLGRDGIEYGGAVGAGAVTGAILGGPAGALAGTLIGAGVITAHLTISHPQATLEPGTVLMFTLTRPLDLVPAGSQGQ
ncbi:MAG TPA: hypothetical protein VMA34_09735 [Terracidiphilus sp.]|nr:hypothetical protein [Terracidiphilus sp.]